MKKTIDEERRERIKKHLDSISKYNRELAIDLIAGEMDIMKEQLKDYKEVLEELKKE